MVICEKYSVFGKFRFFPVALCVLFLFPSYGLGIEIDPELEEHIASDETAGYIVYFPQPKNPPQVPRGGWKEQNDFMSKVLRDTANRSQARVRSYLLNRRIPHRSIWTDNTITVDRSDKESFEGLKNFPEIEAIRAKREPGAQTQQSLEPSKRDPGAQGNEVDKQASSGTESAGHREQNTEER